MITPNWKNIRDLTGVVLSAKADKTLVVEVKRVTMHPIYKKRFTLKKKYYVHDELNTYKAGETVTFLQTRKISKLKSWKVQ